MALKPNFFQAVAAFTLAYQAWKYIKKQKSLLEKWDYDILALRLLGVTKDYLDLQLEIELKNPSAVSLTVSEFEMDVYIDGIKIGNTAKKGQYTIPKYGSNVLTFQVRAYFKALGPSLAMLISKIGKIDEVRVRLKGKMYIETVPGVFAPVPFDVTDNALNLYKYFND
ncbi:MAG: LEA type 2 family protein [Candidatus Omnitrophica bacterium]|nr:LEA type 2 family protein [Candidatus Omnitrophota bacterium]